MKLTGGMTIASPAMGKWDSPDGERFVEKMIPVKIACTRKDIMNIGEMTKNFYGQQQIMISKLSSEVIFI